MDIICLPSFLILATMHRYFLPRRLSTHLKLLRYLYFAFCPIGNNTANSLTNAASSSPSPSHLPLHFNHTSPPPSPKFTPHTLSPKPSLPINKQSILKSSEASQTLPHKLPLRKAQPPFTSLPILGIINACQQSTRQFLTHLS